ncbi:MAG: (Fe-S)-binding protein [Chthonomonas sp.]|nr:(Fe-S)-binding protein [Chthonomonas sp.]
MNESRSLEDLTSACIRCGFCLESCPTFQLTGEETESPRGRIYLVRSAQEGKLPWSQVGPHIEKCLGCRACETACPSGVEYGQIFEIAKSNLEPKWWRRALLRQLTDSGKASRQFRLAALLPGRKLPSFLSRLWTGEPTQARIPKRQSPREYPALESRAPFRGQVALLRGCVMDALFPNVHEATRRLLKRCGYGVIDLEGCCGALNAHSGDLDQARQQFDHLDKSLIIVTNSAGCGSFLKDSGARAFDAAEFLYANGLRELIRSAPGLVKRVTYHDACHLAHGQGVRSQPRELIRSIQGITLIELENADRCCGSAGIYNVQQPTMAKQLLDLKWQSIEATGAEILVSGNPGCHAWIEQGCADRRSPVMVLHTMELLEAAFSGLDELAKK